MSTRRGKSKVLVTLLLALSLGIGLGVTPGDRPAFASPALSLPSGSQQAATDFGDLCADSCVLSGFGATDEMRLVVTSEDGDGLTGFVRLAPGTSVSGLDAVTGYNGGNVSNLTGSTYHELAFVGTQAEINAVLPELQYKAAAGTVETVSISATLAGVGGRTLHYFPGNGHYYEYVDADVNWSTAKSAAEARTFNGLTGYLVTILSDEENNFVKNKVTAPNVWMGATFTPDSGGSPTYSYNTAGAWEWVTGPTEDRVEFWSGTRRGVAVSGRYSQWNTSQPDGSSDCAVTNYNGAGKWDDFACTIQTDYVVEFGGLDGESPTLELTTTLEVFVPYTVTFDSNDDQHQSGTTTGSVPSPISKVSGGTVTIPGNTGTLTRQGFVFDGWNTSSDGSGTPYEENDTFAISSDVTLYAQWSIPEAARLFGLTDGGVRRETIVAVQDQDGDPLAGNVRGITTDGSSVFFLPSNQAKASPVVREVGFDGTLIEDHSISNVPFTVVDGVRVDTFFGGASLEQRDLTYSNGCIFIRENGTTDSKLYCIDTSTWEMSEVTVPTQVPPGGSTAVGFLPGNFWLYGNLIDFPDGRIGAVSISSWNTLTTSTVGNRPGYVENISMATGIGDGECPADHYCKILRLYTVSGSGSSSTLTFSEDIVLADQENQWPSDDHGIATDGTYLYQSHHDQGYRVYGLRSGAPSYVVFDGNDTSSGSPDPCGANSGVSGGRCLINGWTKNSLTVSNATYFGRDHVNKRYLMGDFNRPQFIYTTSATDQPAGVGTVSAPGAPRSVQGVGGNQQVVLSWQAPASNGGGAILSYTVTASPGGATCQTSSTSCTITGLTNGTAYSFAVVATNNGGNSNSASAGPITPSLTTVSRNNSSRKPAPVQPVLTPTQPSPRLPFPPAVPPRPTVLNAPATSPASTGSVDRLVARVAGVPAPVSSETQGDDGVMLSTSSLRLSVKLNQVGSVAQNEQSVPELTVRPGARAAVSGSGLLPNTSVQVWLPNVTDRELGRLSVNANGEITGEVSLSSGRGADPLPIGRQTLQMTGYDEDGNQTVVEMPVNIAQGPPTPEPNREAGSLPDLRPGQSLATSAGVPTAVAVTPFSEQRLVNVDGGDWRLSVAVNDSRGEVGGDESEPFIRMTQSGVGSVNGDGFMPGTLASLWFFSEPTLMGTVTVAEDGSFDVEFLVDAQFIPVGEHTLQVQGVGTDGYIKAANLGVLIDEPPAPTTASQASLMLWWAIAAVIALALIIVLVFASRRRRSA